MTEGIDREMCPALGEVMNGRRHVCNRKGIDQLPGTNLTREIELRLVDINSYHLRAQCSRDHDGRKTDASAAVYSHPFARLHAALIHDRTKRSDEATPEARRGCRVERFGQRHQVQVRVLEGDV